MRQRMNVGGRRWTGWNAVGRTIVGVGGIRASAIVAVGGIVTGRVAEGAGRGVGVGRGLEDRVEIEVLGRDDRNVLCIRVYYLCQEICGSGRTLLSN